MNKKQILIESKPFDIEKSEKVLALQNKWENYIKDYYPSGDDVAIINVLPYLDEFTKMLWYIYSEFGSVRKVAKFLDVTEYKATIAINMMKRNIKQQLKKEGL